MQDIQIEDLTSSFMDQNSINYDNTINQIKQQNVQKKEKQALNQLKFLSEYAEFNESFGAWGEESMVNKPNIKQKKEDFKQNNGKTNSNSNPKLFLKNTLNEMSLALRKLENGNKINQNSKEITSNLLAPKQRQLTQKGNRQKSQHFEYEIDTKDIINDLKKLRDDLQESPEKVCQLKSINRTTHLIRFNQDNLKQNHIKHDEQMKNIANYNNINNNNEDDGQDDENVLLLQRPRSISTNNSRRTKNLYNPHINSQASQLKTQSSGKSLNIPFSNLLGNNNNNNIVNSQNGQGINNIKYPVQGFNNNNNNNNNNHNQNSFQNNDKSIISYIMQIKSKDYEQNNNNNKCNLPPKNQNKIRTSSTVINTQQSETTPTTPQSQNFLIPNCKSYFKKPKNYGVSADFTNSLNPIYNNQNKQQKQLLILKRDDSNRTIKSLQNGYNQQIKQQLDDHKNNDTLKEYEDQTYLKKKENNNIRKNSIHIKKENDNDLSYFDYNFENGQKYGLQKSISNSIQSNDNNQYNFIQNNNNNNQNSQSQLSDLPNQDRKRNNISSHEEQHSNILIDSKNIKNDQFVKDSQSDKENIRNNGNENKNSQNSLICQQEVNSPSSKQFKIKLFEKIKNKIISSSSSTHRVNRSQNLTKLMINQNNVNTSFNNQLNQISYSATPKQNSNNNNNNQNQSLNHRNLSFSKVKSNNNNNHKIQTLLPSNKDINLNNNIEKQNNQNETNIHVQLGKPPQHSRRISNYEDKENEDNQNDQQQLNVNGKKKIMKHILNINENINSIAITQNLTHRVSRENTNSQSYNILKEKIINDNYQPNIENNQNGIFTQQQQQQQNNLLIKIKNNNSNLLQNIDLSTETTPKNHPLQISSHRLLQQQQLQSKYSQNSFDNNKICINNSQILLDESNTQQQQKTSRQTNHIIHKNIPKIPKPYLLKSHQINTETNSIKCSKSFI